MVTQVSFEMQRRVAGNEVSGVVAVARAMALATSR